MELAGTEAKTLDECREFPRDALNEMIEAYRQQEGNPAGGSAVRADSGGGLACRSSGEIGSSITPWRPSRVRS